MGEQLVWNGHTAIVREGGVLHDNNDGGSHPFAVSTVTALATTLAGYTVNGWHLWRRAHDNRPLSALRTDLATLADPSLAQHPPEQLMIGKTNMNGGTPHV